MPRITKTAEQKATEAAAKKAAKASQRAVVVAKAATPESVVAGDSSAKAAFRAHIAKYAEQNPKKYAIKKAALEAKLESIA